MKHTPDLVAGPTLAAYLLPPAISDASLAGLPPETGLYLVRAGRYHGRRRTAFERVYALEAGQTVHTILSEWDHAAA